MPHYDTCPTCEGRPRRKGADYGEHDCFYCYGTGHVWVCSVCRKPARSHGEAYRCEQSHGVDIDGSVGRILRARYAAGMVA